MASALKKRKVDTENRDFKSEWTDKYCFILTNAAQPKPLCLICNETVALIKSSNVKRHYETKHRSFEQNYPLNSEIRAKKISSLTASYEASTKRLVSSLSQQEKTTEASLRVAWILGKHKKPFSDAEVVKECMVEVVGTMFEGKQREEFQGKIKQIPLSDSMAARRTEIISEDLLSQLQLKVKMADCISLAVDESCDATDNAQLMVFVRFYGKTQNVFCEDLLGMTALHTHTRGEDIFEAITKILKDRGINLDSVISVATDGAPAMIGKEKGLVARLKVLNPSLISYHCIIHQSILCANLGEKYANIMENVMKLINFLRASSALQHRLLKDFLSEVNSAFSDLLVHNNVRWLSKGRVLERFWSIRNELETFLAKQKTEKAREYLTFLRNKDSMEIVAFLADITGHLNDLNVKLQGKNQTIFDLMEAVRAFQRKLQLFYCDMQETLLHFPKLKEHIQEANTKESLFCNHGGFMQNLIDNFQSRFQDFTIGQEILLCIKNPYLVKNVGQFAAEAHDSFTWASSATLQIEIIDLQEDAALKAQFNDCDSITFWTKLVIPAKYPLLQKIAVSVLTMFGSTYTCESAFSTMNLVKNKYRTRITDEHLHQSVRMAVTPFVPNFKGLVREKKCQFSH
ncbi:zinc finger BED domain-containing protein 5-like [Dendropsophus ebraccatus]|uniref:zinc finger BED domain-containing protein 5-like n=1 Tax=Dendropsophus ebraccatus TaxID=150705 RepID=UPI0038312685